MESGLVANSWLKCWLCRLWSLDLQQVSRFELSLLCKKDKDNDLISEHCCEGEKGLSVCKVLFIYLPTYLLT